MVIGLYVLSQSVHSTKRRTRKTGFGSIRPVIVGRKRQFSAIRDRQQWANIGHSEPTTNLETIHFQVNAASPRNLMRPDGQFEWLVLSFLC